MTKKNPNQIPILISIPHASTFVPADLRRIMNLNDFQIRRQSDLYTDEIFDIPNTYQVKARISRLVADPNRAPDDIEMECHLCNEGVVVSVDEFGEAIYKEPPSEKHIAERVQKYHETFHEEIDTLTKKAKFLIDGHSLWSTGSPTKPDAGHPRADIVLGNRDFTSCSRNATLKIIKFFTDKGLSVKVNDPYSGKYVLGYHCSRRALPGIQIEFNRALYMNERTLHPHKRKIATLNLMMRDLVALLHQEILRAEERGKRFS